MSIELKIKSKHLALEPAIIKREERKLQHQLAWYKQHHQVTDIYRDEGANKLHHKWWELNTHRKTVVRNEARATYLARAFLAGKPYKSVEAKTDYPALMRNVFPRVVDMVAKYGPNPIRKYHFPDRGYTYRANELAKVQEVVTDWLFKG